MSILQTIIGLFRGGSALGTDRPEALSPQAAVPFLKIIDDNLDPLVATPVKATGSIALAAGMLNESGKYIDIGDGSRTIRVSVGNLGGTGNVGTALDNGGGMTLDQAGARLQAIIEGYLNIKVTRSVGTLTLENRRTGAAGNVTIATSLSAATVTGMSGGVGPDPFFAGNPGSAQVFTMVFAQQPTTGDHATIGADKYEFVTAGGEVATDTNIGVAIGGSAAETLANWIAAINATDANNQHANLLKGDGETPALANGTEPFFADSISTTLRIRSAAAAGSPQIVGSSKSVVLAESLTHASLVWGVGNVNLNTLGGSYASSIGGAAQQKTITAAMVTATSVRFSFPFRVGAFTAQIRTAAGLLRDAPATDTFTINNGDVLVGLTSTDATDIDATDVVVITAWPA